MLKWLISSLISSLGWCTYSCWLCFILTKTWRLIHWKTIMGCRLVIGQCQWETGPFVHQIKLLSLFCHALKLTVISVSQVENDIRSSPASNRNHASVESMDPLMLAKSATRIAILGISTVNSNVRHRLTYFFLSWTFSTLKLQAVVFPSVRITLGHWWSEWKTNRCFSDATPRGPFADSRISIWPPVTLPFLQQVFFILLLLAECLLVCTRT